MKKIITVFLVITFVMVSAGSMPEIASMLSIPNHLAKKLIDAVVGAASICTIIGLAAATGIVGVTVHTIVKKVVADVGLKSAIPL